MRASNTSALGRFFMPFFGLIVFRALVFATDKLTHPCAAVFVLAHPVVHLAVGGEELHGDVLHVRCAVCVGGLFLCFGCHGYCSPFFLRRRFLLYITVDTINETVKAIITVFI